MLMGPGREADDKVGSVNTMAEDIRLFREVSGSLRWL